MNKILVRIIMTLYAGATGWSMGCIDWKNHYTLSLVIACYVSLWAGLAIGGVFLNLSSDYLEEE
jgi:hypothetical protein